MAKLVAAFGATHSIMLVCEKKDWIGNFPKRDGKLPLYDDKGDRRSYEELATKAAGSAARLYNDTVMAERFDETERLMDDLGARIVAARLDVLVIVGDDQEELFGDHLVPGLAIFTGDKIRNKKAVTVAADDWQGRARNRRQEPDADAEYPCNKALAEHLTQGLVDREFDITNLRALEEHQGEGHAFSFIHSRILRGRMSPMVPIVPVFVNTYYPPNQVSPARCIALGKAIGELVASFPGDLRVGILASGGMSHFVVDEALDRGVLDAIGRKDLAYLAAIDPKLLQAGSSEIRNWMVVAAAAHHLNVAWSEYVPGYRSPALTGLGIAFAEWK